MDKSRLLDASKSMEQSAKILESVLRLKGDTDDKLKAFIAEQRTLAAELKDYYKQIYDRVHEIAMKKHNQGEAEAQKHVKHLKADPKSKPWI